MEKHIFDYSKLIGRIVEKFGTKKKFANAIGQSSTNLCNKLTGKTQISSEDIANWCPLLQIDYIDIPLYFFVLKVKKC